MNIPRTLQRQAQNHRNETVRDPARRLIDQEEGPFALGVDREQQRTTHTNAVPRSQKAKSENLHQVKQIPRRPERAQSEVMQSMMPTTHESPSGTDLAVTYNNCRHCRKALAVLTDAEHAFCCPGCQSAYRFISKLGLEGFYQRLKNQAPQSLNRENFSPSPNQYDDMAMLSLFGRKRDSKQWSVALYDARFDCLACEWLLQNSLRQLFPAVTLNFNLSDRSIELTFDPDQHKLSAILQLMQDLGYAPSMLPNADETDEDQKGLLRLAVASFVATNVMLLALADYLEGGQAMQADLRLFFHMIQAVLTGVSVIYVGRPFFEKAWVGLKRFRLVVDLPLALAIGGIYLLSLSSLLGIKGLSGLYFDSLSGLLAFLTLGRVLQGQSLKKSQKLLSRTKINELSHYLVHLVHNDETLVTAAVKDVKVGDKVRLFPGEAIPVNGTLCNDVALINLEQISGEAQPKQHTKSAAILAGSSNSSQGPIDVMVTESGINGLLTRLGKPDASLATVQPSVFTQLAFRYFSLFTLCLVGLVGAYGAWAEAPFIVTLNRMLAILVVACPCTFALGIPLIMSRAVVKAAQKGIAVNDVLAFERLGRIAAVFFDKTGTLTTGLSEVSQVIELTPGHLHALSPFLATLDLCSNHPTAIAVAKWAHARSESKKSIASSVEVVGKGLILTILSQTYLLGNRAFLEEHGINVPQTMGTTYLASATQCIAAFHIKETWAMSSQFLINEWRQKGIQSFICSGDATNRVAEAAIKLGIPAQQAAGNLSPEAKVQFCANHMGPQQTYLAVGNGLNDIPFINAAQVSVAVGRSPGQLRTKCSLELWHHDLSLLDTARSLSLAANKRIRAVTLLAIAFNTVGLTLATLGIVTPVVAAVLMPLSSLTIIAVALLW